MKRTTIVAEESLLVHLHALAQRSAVSVSEIVRRALKEFVSRHAPSSRIPSFVGSSSSGGKLRLSERAEEMLFDRRRGR